MHFHEFLEALVRRRVGRNIYHQITVLEYLCLQVFRDERENCEVTKLVKEWVSANNRPLEHHLVGQDVFVPHFFEVILVENSELR